MNARRIFLFFLCALLASGALRAAEPVSLSLRGTVTNTTMEISALARMELVIDGEKVTGRLVTEKPLLGTGAVTGRFVGGWLELSGKTDEGFTLQFRGTLSPRDYRGTYVAVLPGQLAQYGRFVFLRGEAGK
jgi:hypothetical protein